MTCREVIGFLSDYVSAALPPEQRAALDAHMRRCPNCATYLRSYQDTIKIGKQACAGRAAETGSLPEELVQAVLAARGKRN